MTTIPPKQWVQESLMSVLSAPGPLHMPKLPFGIRGGPGPIDVFSSRYANLFTDDVEATVNGEALDKAGLKDKLVILKKSFNPATATFSDLNSWPRSNVVGTERVATRLQWSNDVAKVATAEDAVKNSEIIWDAWLQNTGNLRQIHQISLTTDLLPI